jgi:hypothetical protein
VGLFVNCPVTLASRGLQPGPVEYCDLPSAVLKQAFCPEFFDGVGDTSSWSTDHVGEFVMCQADGLRPGPVAGGEQPAAETLLGFVKSVAMMNRLKNLAASLKISNRL